MLDAGARTQLSGVVAALLVLLFMVAIPRVTAFLPPATLAAVVIVAASSFIGVLQGIALAIGLSLLACIQGAWDPYRTELAMPPRRRGAPTVPHASSGHFGAGSNAPFLARNETLETPYLTVAACALSEINS
ncbi:UNVERIFIED_ORG: hypothetical protein ABIB52_001081 [Arthrobacter sp. UYCu721]